MLGKRRLPPDPVGDAVGLVVSRRSAGKNLRAHALDRVGVEARLRSAPGAADRSRPPAGRAASGPSRGMCRGLTEKRSSTAVSSSRCWNALASRSPAPSSSSAAAMLRDARLDRGVLVGAAFEGEVHGDQRDRRLANQPGLDAAGRDHPLDVGGLREARAQLRRTPASPASGAVDICMVTNVCPRGAARSLIR